MLVAVRIAAATARGARPNAIHHLLASFFTGTLRGDD
jgi:hypothetical protein